MRDTERLRKEADQLLADAHKAKRQGKSELTQRLQARAAQLMQDAAVLDAAEARLQAERASTQAAPKLSVVHRNNRQTMTRIHNQGRWGFELLKTLQNRGAGQLVILVVYIGKDSRKLMTIVCLARFGAVLECRGCEINTILAFF